MEAILKAAYSAGVKFKVVVLDARPQWDGRALRENLVAAGMDVSYAGLHALAYVMRKATKVLIGAHACLSNGAVMSAAGSAMVALSAARANVPVLVACETYKFAERVMLDSICSNELGDPDDLIQVLARVTRPGDRQAHHLVVWRPPRAQIMPSRSAMELAGSTGDRAAASPVPHGCGGGSINQLACLNDWRDIPTLRLLNLLYDVTPSSLVTMVISEVGLTPPSAIPVIIREYSQP